LRDFKPVSFRQKRELESNREATIVCQQKQIEALTAGLQKVSAQLEPTKSASQTVLNNQDCKRASR